MARKKKQAQIELTYFPTEMLVTPNQLAALSGYEFQEKGTMFESEIEYRLVVVTGKLLTEEPVNDDS